MTTDDILTRLHEIRAAFRTLLNGRRWCLTCLPVVESELLVVALERDLIQFKLVEERRIASE